MLGWVEIDEPVARALDPRARDSCSSWPASRSTSSSCAAGCPRRAAASRSRSRSPRGRRSSLRRGGLVETPLLVAIVLSATSLGVIDPRPQGRRRDRLHFGQLVVAAGSIADFAAIILLSIFFSGEGGPGSTLLLIGSLFALAVAVYFAVARRRALDPAAGDLLRLQDTTAQIRVRGAFVLLVGFAALAEQLGLEVILGAFIAGAMLRWSTATR